MAIDVMGNMIRMPVGDTGTIKFVAEEGSLSESDKGIFTLARRDGTAAVDLWDTPENSPDAAPTLWQDIAYRKGVRIIPAVITAGEAFAKGEHGWWGDALYESLIDANVYTPEQYPAGWQTVY